MNTDRSDILNQLATGRISADEAARLLREPAAAPAPAVGEDRPRAGSLAAANHWLRVRVTDLHTGQQKVNVNLPLSWVELGLTIGARYRPELAGFDLVNLLEQIQAGADGKLVEVEDLDDDERVEIFVD